MSCVVELPPTSTSYSEQRNVSNNDSLYTAGAVSNDVLTLSIPKPSKLKVLAIIPCRSGSKGLPGKNIRQLNGTPLMSYAIKPALECSLVDRVIVDTDDEGYAAIAQKLGAEVPFLRPKHLAEDVPTEDVIIHALNWLQEHEGKQYNIVVTLQCTTPGVKPEELIELIEAVSVKGFSSSATICEIRERPEWMFTCSPENQRIERWYRPATLRGEEGVRQSLPQLFRLTGAAYATSVMNLLPHRTIMPPPVYGVLMPPERSQDIDTLFDFHLVEKMISEW